MTNPLVVAPAQTSAAAGVPLLQDAVDLRTSLQSGDWASSVLGAAGAGMDALGAVMDPFGTILASGVGWLLEHVGPLKKALDALTGKPEQITANAQTWQNVSTALGEIGQDLGRAVEADLQNWSGEAADVYRARTADLANLLAAGQEAAAGAASGVQIAGQVAGSVRELVRGIVAEVIGRLISWALQVLLTAGIGLAWVVPQVVRAVAATAAKIASVTGKLVKAMSALSPLMKKASDIFERASVALHGTKTGTVKPSGAPQVLLGGGKRPYGGTTRSTPGTGTTTTAGAAPTVTPAGHGGPAAGGAPGGAAPAPAPIGPPGSHTNPRPTQYAPPVAPGAPGFQLPPGHRPPIQNWAHQHVIHGEWNSQGQVVGGHVYGPNVTNPSANVAQYGYGVLNQPTTGSNHYTNGVYTQHNPTVTFGGGYGNHTKPGVSTMFPPNLTEPQVQHLGGQAWNNGAPYHGFNPHNPQKWSGHAALPNGGVIKIEGYTNQGGFVKTYYPSSQQ